VSLLENWFFHFVKNAGKNKGVFPVKECSKNCFRFRTHVAFRDPSFP